jgi:predicted dithiol-disulfide oxidoreductase (DUF899 family)
MQVVSREDWLTTRKELLVKEKAAVRAQDAFNSQLRDFPMVKVDEEYIFENPEGKVTLAELFQGRKQLIVYHFMLGPDEEAGCPGCSFLTDNLPSSLTHLNAANTTLVLVSRAPVEKIEQYKARMGWNFPWYSSSGSKFNWDFNVSLDEAKAPPIYNVRDLTIPSSFSTLTLTNLLVQDNGKATQGRTSRLERLLQGERRHIPYVLGENSFLSLDSHMSCLATMFQFLPKQ